MIEQSGAIEREICERYVGRPYCHRGRGPDSLDCWGLIIDIYRRFGVRLFDLESYEVGWANGGADYFMENYHRDWMVVDVPRFPDGVLFKTRSGIAKHAGIVLSNGLFLHAMKKVGVIKSPLNQQPWRGQFAGFFRCKLL